MKSILIIAMLVLGSQWSWAQDEQAAEESAPAAETTNTSSTEFGDVTGTEKYKITCQLNDDKREISVVAQEDGAVGVVYTKFGTTKTIALAKNDPSYADQVAQKIKGNLEAATYTCSQAGAEAPAATPAEGTTEAPADSTEGSQQ